MKIVLATKNKHKIEEITHALNGCGIEILSLNDFPDMPDVIEDGLTLEENSYKKAKEIFEYAKIPSLADDTGLEVDFLNGAPGVYSARYAGEECSYDDNNNKLLKALDGVETAHRTARFRCVMTFFTSDKIEVVAGVLPGKIREEKTGTNGFGYDPIFQPDGFNKVLAEMNMAEKNAISHRGQAVRKMAEYLKSISNSTKV